jgi:hypothetical protein
MKLSHNFAVLLIPAMLLILTGCPKIEQTARDTSAALGGAITQAQAQHQTECAATPTLSVCTLINKSVDAQHALITADEAYCGWQEGVLPSDQDATCVPVSSASVGLQAAIQNANNFIGSLKAVIK